MARAKYIHYRKAARRDQLIAVFGDEVEHSELRRLTNQLLGLPGIDARIIREFVAGASTGVNTLVVTVNPSVDIREAVRRIKDVTNPELPYTIGSFTLTLLLCQCSYVSSRTDMLFVVGLGPESEDEVKFKSDYYTGLEQLPMAELLAGPPPFDALMDALQELLRALGAHVAELRLKTELDTHPCNHPA